jgi:DNA-directed RNA polymerase subunit beta'
MSPEAVKEFERVEGGSKNRQPEPGGLFCQRLFGPVKDDECAGGKDRRIKYKGGAYDRYSVEVTLSRIRRESMGHVGLAVPIAHI